MVSLYNSLIKPHVDYGILAWGSAANTHLNLIDKRLNKVVRMMSFKGKYESAKPLYNYFNILPLNESIKLSQGKFMWTLIQNQHPESIQKKFQRSSSTAINNKVYIAFFSNENGAMPMLLEIPPRCQNVE